MGQTFDRSIVDRSVGHNHNHCFFVLAMSNTVCVRPPSSCSFLSIIPTSFYIAAIIKLFDWFWYANTVQISSSDSSRRGGSNVSL